MVLFEQFFYIIISKKTVFLQNKTLKRTNKSLISGSKNIRKICEYQKWLLSLHRKFNMMEIKFDKKYLSELYYDGKCSDKKHRFQPQIVKTYKKRIDLLENVPSVESLYKYNALHYEVLQGDKKGLEAIKVNDQYRIEFSTTKIESETIVTVCNIIELSNHYK